jgi:type VI secretion system protein ImpA
MRFDYLSEPVSSESPAGPDLDEEADSDYLNYVLAADGRMPERYFTVDQSSGNYVRFDSSTVDLAAEISAIDGLLRRTRDLRLLGFDARFHALAGDILGFCEAMQGMALLVGGFWAEYHPRAVDGDYIQRQNAIDGLDDQPRVVQPLQYANIAGGTRYRAVTYRNYLVATDKVTPREDEERVPLEEIARTISGLNQKGDPVEDLRKRVEDVHAAVQAALEAIAAIRQTFAANVDAEFVPSLKALPETLKGIADLITTYRRDLLPGGAAGEAGAEAGEEGETGGAAVPQGAVKTHAAARRALGAVERYLLFNEPSSPALVLVHQSRMLIGRPLVEALTALMPTASEQAALRFDAGFRFDIDLARMRSVTDDALAQYESELSAAATAEANEDSGVDGSELTDSGWGSSWGSSEESSEEPASVEPSSDSDGWGVSETEASGDAEGAAAEDESAGATEESAEAAPESDSAEAEAMPELEALLEAEAPAPAPAPAAPPPSGKFVATSRAQAADLISSTESFFRTVEPSSPLPTLLSKARGYLNRDFASILSELMPRAPEE